VICNKDHPIRKERKEENRLALQLQQTADERNFLGERQNREL
jgi:hypothetical protein